MKILAIETSTMLGGVAIMDESEGLVVEIRLNVKTAHSERLMTVIDHALKQAGMTASDIDVFGVAIGPGSFTGLRIGLSTIKGFSYATGKPVVSVPTLEAFAWNFPYSSHPVCVMLDARKKEVYAAVFKWKGSFFERVIGETSVKPSDLVRNLKGPVIFAGEGALLYKESILEALGNNALFAPRQSMIPSPANVALLGMRMAADGDFSEPASLVPLYIRKSEAEIKTKTDKIS
jgi:tRNA threonylcarbamoyladenosine biosynthesis protein TsaB